MYEYSYLLIQVIEHKHRYYADTRNYRCHYWYVVDNQGGGPSLLVFLNEYVLSDQQKPPIYDVPDPFMMYMLSFSLIKKYQNYK